MDLDRFARRLFFLLFLLFLGGIFPSFSALHAEEGIPYTVEFKGIKKGSTLEIIKEVSQLESLKNKPPATLTALRRRADSDLPNIVRVLHSYAYYNSHIQFRIDETQSPVRVIVDIDTDEPYPLYRFQVIDYSDVSEEFDLFEPRPDIPETEAFSKLKLERLGIEIGKEAYAKTILLAQSELVEHLKNQGYPLTKLIKREVVIDQEQKNVSVYLVVEPGPRLKFGPTNITGLKSVVECFVRKSITWCEGDWYSPRQVENTIASLEQRRLFSSIEITHASQAGEDQLLPMEIEVIESLHRSIGVGTSYTTQRGPGLLFEWENRNMDNLGKQLSFRSEIWTKSQNISLVHRTPHFPNQDEDFVIIGEYDREDTRAFDEYSYSLSGMIEKRMNEWNSLSYGLLLQRIYSNRTGSEKDFLILKVPFFYKYSTVNNILNPTEGKHLNIRYIPAARAMSLEHPYLIAEIIGSMYLPMDAAKRSVLALKVDVGFLPGTQLTRIPKKDRFYAGSESTLRGYEYLTVSPINPTTGELVGGRSIFIFTVEPRFQIDEKNGFVVFYEVGNVYTSSFPKLNRKQLQSTGLGWRYFTPIGPLRFDVAFPLNKRPALDSDYQFYFSVGQAF